MDSETLLNAIKIRYNVRKILFKSNIVDTLVIKIAKNKAIFR